MELPFEVLLMVEVNLFLGLLAAHSDFESSLDAFRDFFCNGSKKTKFCQSEAIPKRILNLKDSLPTINGIIFIAQISYFPLEKC